MKKTISAIGVFVLLLGGSIASAQMSGGMMKDQSGTMHSRQDGRESQHDGAPPDDERHDGHVGPDGPGRLGKMSGMMKDMPEGDIERDVWCHERNVASDAGYVHDDGEWKVHSSRNDEDAGANDEDPGRNVRDGNAQVVMDVVASALEMSGKGMLLMWRRTSHWPAPAGRVRFHEQWC